MSEQKQKDIVFYSNRDDYSKRVLKMISDQNRDNNFIFICVDDRNIQLPSFLKAVPTIFLVKEKKVLVDETIEEYLTPKKEVQDDCGELGAYYDSSSGFSSSFSNLDDSNLTAKNSMFSYLDDDLTGGGNSDIQTPEESKNNTNNSFEQLTAQREQELNGIQRN